MLFFWGGGCSRGNETVDEANRYAKRLFLSGNHRLAKREYSWENSLKQEY